MLHSATCFLNLPIGADIKRRWEKGGKSTNSCMFIVRLAAEHTMGKAVMQKLILTHWRDCTNLNLCLTNADKRWPPWRAIERCCCSGKTVKGDEVYHHFSSSLKVQLDIWYIGINFVSHMILQISCNMMPDSLAIPSVDSVRHPVLCSVTWHCTSVGVTQYNAIDCWITIDILVNGHLGGRTSISLPRLSPNPITCFAICRCCLPAPISLFAFPHPANIMQTWSTANVLLFSNVDYEASLLNLDPLLEWEGADRCFCFQPWIPQHSTWSLKSRLDAELSRLGKVEWRQSSSCGGFATHTLANWWPQPVCTIAPDSST